MKRQLLLQPNGKYAIFCNTRDSFVGVDLDRAAAAALLCLEFGMLTVKQAFERVSGLEWEECISDLVELNEDDGHMQQELDKIAHLMGRNIDPYIHDGCHPKCIKYGCEHERVWKHHCDRADGLYECRYTGESLDI